MANDIGIRIGVDGEKEFKTALSAINAQLKNLSSEMKATVTSMTGMDSAESRSAGDRMVEHRLQHPVSRVRRLC